MPLGSEIFVIAMVVSGYSTVGVFAAATAGNTLGSVTNYYIGKYGNRLLYAKFVDVKPEKRKKLERTYQKYGSPVLFFAWAPVVGDALTVIAGFFNLNLIIFTLWVVFGKALRYILIILTAISF